MIGSQCVLVQPLQTCQPLAQRVVSTILVRCPLQGVSCTWKGDYGDLQDHLTSPTAHTTTLTEDDQGQGQGQGQTTQSIATQVTTADRSAETSTMTTEAMDIEPDTTFNEARPMTIATTTTTTTTTTNTTPTPNTTTATTTTTIPSTATTPPPSNTNAATETVARILNLSASLKEQANSKFSSGHYQEAKSLYTKAISVLEEGMIPHHPDNRQQQLLLLGTLYCNRAATHLQLSSFQECLDDCRSALSFDPTLIKAYMRSSRAYTQKGDFVAACDVLQQALHEPTLVASISSGDKKLLEREWAKAQSLVESYNLGIQQLSQSEYAAAKATFGNLLRESLGPPVLLGAAKADLGLGLTDSALTWTMRVLQKHPQHPEACLIRGQVMCLMNDFSVGLTWMKQALRYDPDDATIKDVYRKNKQRFEWIEAAQQHHFKRQFEQAIELWTKALSQVDITLPVKSPLYAHLYTQRAEAFLRLKQYDKALKDCALAVYAQEDCLPAWLVQFQALHGMEQHETALEQVTDLIRKVSGGEDHPSSGSIDARLRKAYERADFLVRKAKRPNFYTLLGVSPVASEIEIKKAYKRKALEYHPDKVPPEQREQAQKQFQLLGQGLEILTNDFQRRLYDEGYDVEAIRERVEAANQAAHHHSSSRRPYHGHY